MNDFPLNLLLGMIAGFSVSMPLGPAGLFCIQRTLSKGQRSGLVAGLGAATSDIIYALLAILSLSFINNFIENNKNLLFFISGLGLMIIGIAIYSTNPVKQLRQNRESKKFVEDYFTGFLMSITNPGCLFLIIGVFAFLGTTVDRSSGSFIISAILLGVFLGGSLWWFFLSTIISLFRKKIRLRQLWNINRFAGIALMVLGMVAGTKGLSGLLRTLIH
ncbi:MAG TPA: LysE family transporter [Bacteroidales bacterium]|jgi:threonine/homoserine/homoserine lactone efflux protein|nr:LysE family transporter [Bacteroidales bacterium]MCZ2417139.1 LysE family translocator [Burkholderiales bacterium]OQC58400.1 MAG: leucine export protein LeuE [Bacteroidetes bacterium ADurb.Bin013]MBP8999779.1 LysE family transporter [Bacteroidales bacterium]MBV6456571.1 hypothetical protein [Bacteroidales bacterium]